MRILPNVVVVASMFALVACGGSSGGGAKEPDPWADFKGTYGGTAEPRTNGSNATSAREARRDAKDAKNKPEAKDAEETAAAAPAKKTSKATIKGQSISTIDDGALGEASKGPLKTKVVGSTIATGAQYERVKVQLKGAAVVIIRPSTSPDGNASVDAPKARNGSLGKSEASYYDEDADVLVIVDAGKKSASERVLGSLVSR